MAFGFLKRKVYADIVYMNGHIHTQDPEYPWASAVACKDCKVMAVGDFAAMDDIVSADTTVVDLLGRYLFPGFIDVYSTPVLQAFNDAYFNINKDWDAATILDILADYAEGCEENVIFGYGFHERVLAHFENEEAAHTALDEIDKDRPILLLGETGQHYWVNTVAAEIIRTAAEDQETDIISINFIMNILDPLPLEHLETVWKNHAEALADKGFTSVLNLCAPDCFTDAYLDNILSTIGEGEGDIMQRFHGSIYVNRAFPPQLVLHRLSVARTVCIELDSLVTADFVELDVSEEDDIAGFSQAALNTLCLNLAEHGCGIHLDARDKHSFDKAEQSFGLVREKGYHNIPLILASRYTPTDNFKGSYLATLPTAFTQEDFYARFDTVEEAINALTVDAAELLGKSKILGSIEKGKRADFVVFAENPLERNVNQFAEMHADLTVLDGMIVYDAAEAAADEMCDLLFSMQL